MTRADVLKRLKVLEPDLRARGVAALYIFGSYARDEARPESDIDLFADFERGNEPNLARFMDTRRDLEKAFPDLDIAFGTRESVVPTYRPSVESDAIRVF